MHVENLAKLILKETIDFVSLVLIITFIKH